jgi:hypothetical protein
MQIPAPITQWFENDKADRWVADPAVPSDPPEGYSTRVRHVVLPCMLLESRLPSGETALGFRGPGDVRVPDTDIVLAMTRPTMIESKVILQRALLERRQQMPAALADRIAFTAQVALGRAHLPRTYLLEHALLIVSRACERCRLALAWQYGLPRGFPAGSPAYAEHLARCEFCAPPPVPKPEPEVQSRPALTEGA